MDFFDVDAILIKNATMPFIDENFFYFTHLNGVWEESIVLVTDDKVEIIAPLLEKREGIHVFNNKKERDNILIKLTKNMNKIGVNEKGLIYKDYVHLKKIFGRKMVDVSKQLEMMRAIKTRWEIKQLKKAAEIANKIVNKIEYKGKNELEVAGEIDCMIRKSNAMPSFDTIVAFGKNSSYPHHLPTNKKFSYPVLIDVGAKYNGYCSDITRTFIEKSHKEYEIIEEALYIAIDSIKDGVKARNVYKKVDDFLKKNGIKMIHALGHSIGIKVHDGLAINKKANFEFKENMTFAIEPAGYFKNFGIRIEEDVVVKKNKAEVISK